MRESQRRVDCDVLVIGGGAAGLTAAIEARERGASVLVAAKGRAGRGGNTAVAGGQFSAVIPHEGSDDSPELHFQDSLRAGKGINDDILLRTLVAGAGPRVLKLERWGVRLRRSGGELVRRANPGHSRPRGIPTDSSDLPVTLRGLSVTLPLRAAAEMVGVRFLDGSPAVRLLVAEGEVCGALLIDSKRGEPLLVRAPSVVVAAGGAGHIYSSTTNTRGICGDSYGLLLRAGATLRDMEFVQVYPCQMSHPVRMPISTAVFIDGATLRNRHRERFMPLYDPVNEDRVPRDAMARAVFLELRKGNGVDGELFVDLSGVPEAMLQTKYFDLAKDMARRGIDLSRTWLRVSPMVHYFMGGAVVDDRCRTGVPGLFAAGEAVGGTHGANRLAGNSLAETVVFGGIAGESAAEHALSRSTMPEPPIPSLSLPAAEGVGESLDAFRAELRRAMWSGASVVRSEASLRSALATVRDCLGTLESCSAASPTEAARREETRLMGLTAEAVILSALARRESRGAHYREDHPSTDNGYLGSHTVRLVGESLEVGFLAKTKPIGWTG